MTNMKLTPSEARAETSCSVSPGPEYPYGLRIELNDDALSKLGMTGLPAVGAVLSLAGRVEVCAVSAYDGQDGPHRSVSLQITDLELAAVAEKPDVADLLYRTTA